MPQTLPYVFSADITPEEIIEYVEKLQTKIRSHLENLWIMYNDKLTMNVNDLIETILFELNNFHEPSDYKYILENGYDIKRSLEILNNSEHIYDINQFKFSEKVYSLIDIILTKEDKTITLNTEKEEEENTKDIKWVYNKLKTCNHWKTKKVLKKHFIQLLKKPHDNSFYNRGIYFNNVDKFLFKPFSSFTFPNEILCIINDYLIWENKYNSKEEIINKIIEVKEIPLEKEKYFNVDVRSKRIKYILQQRNAKMMNLYEDIDTYNNYRKIKSNLFHKHNDNIFSICKRCYAHIFMDEEGNYIGHMPTCIYSKRYTLCDCTYYNLHSITCLFFSVNSLEYQQRINEINEKDCYCYGNCSCHNHNYDNIYDYSISLRILETRYFSEDNSEDMFIDLR